MLGEFFSGFAVSGGLIVAIGAQNAFVLTQGLKRNYVLPVALICSFFDALFITAGVAGMGSIFASNIYFQLFAAIGGAAFLFVYGLNSFRSAMKRKSLTETETAGSLKKVLITLTFVTILNPHVYIDTFLLIGSVSSQYPPDGRLVFGLGAVTASIIWFFSLSFGARLLEPMFKNHKSWVVFDTIIGICMWAIAISMSVYAYKLYA